MSAAIPATEKIVHSWKRNLVKLKNTSRVTFSLQLARSWDIVSFSRFKIFEWTKRGMCLGKIVREFWSPYVINDNSKCTRVRTSLTCSTAKVLFDIKRQKRKTNSYVIAVGAAKITKTKRETRKVNIIWREMMTDEPGKYTH